MGNRMQAVVRNSFWGMASRIVQIVCPFIVRTVLIYVLGAEYAGLNGLFTSILKVLSLTELGFSSAITYNMYEPIAKHEYRDVCALLNLYKKIYRVVGMIVLSVGIALIPVLKYLVHGQYPSEINIYILYLIYLLNTCMTYFLFSYRTSLLNAFQRYDRISRIAIICNMILYILEIVVLLVIGNYYLFVLSSLATTILNNIMVYYDSKRLFPEIVCKGDVSSETMQDIKKRVRALLGHRIGTAVITSTDSIIISAFLGLVEVAYFNNYYLIISAIIGVIDTVLGGMVASVGNYIVEKTREECYRLFLRMNFVLTWGVGWCAICYVCLIQDFMTIWIGKEFVYDSWITVMLFGVYFYTWKIRSVNVRYKESAGMWQDDFWKPYVAAILNVLLNISLIKYIGIDGVLLSTIIAMIFVNLPWEIYVLHKNMFCVSTKRYYRALLYRTMCVVLAGVLTWFVCDKIRVGVASALFIKGAICVVLPNIVLVLCWHKDENALFVYRTISRMLRSKKNAHG